MSFIKKLFAPSDSSSPDVEAMKSVGNVKGLIIALGYKRDRKRRSTIDREGDKAAEVREAAAWALGELGDARAVEALEKALNDNYFGVRKAAIEALGCIGNQHTVELLTPFLREERLGRVALRALESLNWQPKDDTQRAWVAFINITTVSGAEERHLAELVSLGAAAVEPLVMVYMHHIRKEVCEAAGQGLVRIGDAAVEPLVAELKKKDWAVRHKAAAQLMWIGDARAVEPLVMLAHDKSRASMQAINTLEVILKRDAANVTLGDLRAVVRLNDTIRVEYKELSPINGEEKIHSLVVNCREVKELAERELSRRGSGV